jgi:hypothetical protein
VADLRGIIADAAGALLAVPALYLAMVSVTPFPFFDFDPFEQPPTMTALGPTGMLACCTLMLVGCGLAVLARGVAGRGWIVLGTAGFALVCGAGVMVWHAARSDMEHVVVGSPWLAMLAAGLGAWALGGMPGGGARVRAVLALAAGFSVMLVARGVVQVLVEHPQTVAAFEQNRESILAARGWSAGSEAAAMYERRLRHAEGTGWFGLANVYATFAAAAFAGGVGLAVWAGTRGARGTGTRARLHAAMPGLVLAGVGLAGLVLAGSKGGYAAAGLGATAGMIAAAFVRYRVPRGTDVPARLARRVPAVLCLAAVAIPLGAVAARGVVGERIGELSLLFRAFYWRGAARVFLESPVLGTGPAGFREAYMRLKVPIAPEDVTSPHSVLADWAACLGVAGVAWCAVLLAALWAAGRGLARPDPAERPDEQAWPRGRGLIVFGACAAALGSMWTEQALLTPDGVLARVVGLAGWLALALWIARQDRRGLGIAACGVVVAGVAHAQIELTPTIANAAPLLGVLVGAALASCGVREDARAPATGTGRITRVGAVPSPREPLAVLVALGPLAAAGTVGGTARVIWTWEHALRDAAGPAVALAGVDQRDGRSPNRAAVVAAREHAAKGLARALALRPGHAGTRVAATRAALVAAAWQGWPGEATAAALDAARAGTAGAPTDPGAWGWSATVAWGLAADPATPFSDAQRAGLRREALAAWERRAELEPHGPEAAVRAMRAAAEMGEAARAARWAAEVLGRDERVRLDPIRRVGQADRAFAEALAAETVTPDTGTPGDAGGGPIPVPGGP